MYERSISGNWKTNIAWVWLHYTLLCAHHTGIFFSFFSLIISFLPSTIVGIIQFPRKVTTFVAYSNPNGLNAVFLNSSKQSLWKHIDKKSLVSAKRSTPYQIPIFDWSMSSIIKPIPKQLHSAHLSCTNLVRRFHFQKPAVNNWNCIYIFAYADRLTNSRTAKVCFIKATMTL